METGNKSHVRLKLLPRSRLPFTTQTFRVTDRSLLAGVPKGAWRLRRSACYRPEIAASISLITASFSRL